jgi:site-specific DNA-methyltransferase (adenine-specific)
MIFADPPDNLGVKYEGFRDKWKGTESYLQWLNRVLLAVSGRSEIFWFSYNHRYQIAVLSFCSTMTAACNCRGIPVEFRQFIWRYTFGQHRTGDCGNGYRPILRIMSPYVKLYPDAIRVKSARQLKYNDKRADPKGRVPDDVWEFPRVCGTFRERRKWHPCQHPKGLLRRMVLFSTRPGDLVIDMFAGSGNMLEVCRELGRACIGIEISKFYCEKIAGETGAVPESAGK